MPRLGKEKELEKEKEIASGYLICKMCNEKRELHLFNRQIKTEKVYYKTNKCKVCVTGKMPRLSKTIIEGKIRDYTKLKIKSDIIISPEAKEFIKRVIYMRYYIDSVEAFKLVHYHIETFGHNDRLILDIEKELTIMFVELLEVYKREQEKNNI